MCLSSTLIFSPLIVYWKCPLVNRLAKWIGKDIVLKWVKRNKVEYKTCKNLQEWMSMTTMTIMPVDSGYFFFCFYCWLSLALFRTHKLTEFYQWLHGTTSTANKNRSVSLNYVCPIYMIGFFPFFFPSLVISRRNCDIILQCISNISPSMKEQCIVLCLQHQHNKEKTNKYYFIDCSMYCVYTYVYGCRRSLQNWSCFLWRSPPSDTDEQSHSFLRLLKTLSKIEWLRSR